MIPSINHASRRHVSTALSSLSLPTAYNPWRYFARASTKSVLQLHLLSCICLPSSRVFLPVESALPSHVAALCLCGSVPQSPRLVSGPFSPSALSSREGRKKKRREIRVFDIEQHGTRCPPPRARAMEQIQTQASDLRYLTAPVGALSDSASVSYETPQSRPQMSPGSAMYGDNSALQPGGESPGDANAGASKRKSVEDGAGNAKQTRSKRNRVSLRVLG